MHDHPAAALFGHILVSVLGLHVLLRKVAVIILEPFVVHRNELTENLALHLLHKIIDRVPVDKMPLFSVVSVQVKIK